MDPQEDKTNTAPSDLLDEGQAAPEPPEATPLGWELEPSPWADGQTPAAEPTPPEMLPGAPVPMPDEPLGESMEQVIQDYLNGNKSGFDSIIKRLEKDPLIPPDYIARHYDLLAKRAAEKKNQEFLNRIPEWAYKLGRSGTFDKTLDEMIEANGWTDAETLAVTSSLAELLQVPEFAEAIESGRRIDRRADFLKAWSEVPVLGYTRSIFTGAEQGGRSLIGIAGRAANLLIPKDYEFDIDEYNRRSGELAQASMVVDKLDWVPDIIQRGGRSAIRSTVVAAPAVFGGGAYTAIGITTADVGSNAFTEATDAGLVGSKRVKHVATQMAIEAGTTLLAQGVAKFLKVDALSGTEGLLNKIKAGQRITPLTIRSLIKEIGLRNFGEAVEENIIEVTSAIASAANGVGPELTAEGLADIIAETTVSTVLQGTTTTIYSKLSEEGIRKNLEGYAELISERANIDLETASGVVAAGLDRRGAKGKVEEGVNVELLLTSDSHTANVVMADPSAAFEFSQKSNPSRADAEAIGISKSISTSQAERNKIAQRIAKVFEEGPRKYFQTKEDAAAAEEAKKNGVPQSEFVNLPPTVAEQVRSWEIMRQQMEQEQQASAPEGSAQAAEGEAEAVTGEPQNAVDRVLKGYSQQDGIRILRENSRLISELEEAETSGDQAKQDEITSKLEESIGKMNLTKIQEPEAAKDNAGSEVREETAIDRLTKGYSEKDAIKIMKENFTLFAELKKAQDEGDLTRQEEISAQLEESIGKMNLTRTEEANAQQENVQQQEREADVQEAGDQIPEQEQAQSAQNEEAQIETPPEPPELQPDAEIQPSEQNLVGRARFEELRSQGIPAERAEAQMRQEMEQQREEEAGMNKKQLEERARELGLKPAGKSVNRIRRELEQRREEQAFEPQPEDLRRATIEEREPEIRNRLREAGVPEVRIQSAMDEVRQKALRDDTDMDLDASLDSNVGDIAKRYKGRRVKVENQTAVEAIPPKKLNKQGQAVQEVLSQNTATTVEDIMASTGLSEDQVVTQLKKIAKLSGRRRVRPGEDNLKKLLRDFTSDQIKQSYNKLGKEVQVLDSFESIPDKDARERLRKFIESVNVDVNKVNGLRDNETGIEYVFTDAVQKSGNTVREIAIHEMTHSGLSIIKDEALDKILDAVYENAVNEKDSARQDILEKINKQYGFMNPDSDEGRRMIAEEYIAHVAQNRGKSSAAKTKWQRTVRAIKQWISDTLGVDIEYDAVEVLIDKALKLRNNPESMMRSVQGGNSIDLSRSGKGSSKLLHDIATNTKNKYGFTVDGSGNYRSTGVVVAPLKSTEYKTKTNKFSEKEANKFLKKHGDMIRKEGMHVGGWLDEDTDSYVLDVSIPMPRVVDAVKIGLWAEQDAIYNIETEQEIKLKDKQGNPIIPDGIDLDIDKVMSEKPDDIVQWAINQYRSPKFSLDERQFDKYEQEEGFFKPGGRKKDKMVVTHWSVRSGMNKTMPAKNGKGGQGREGQRMRFYDDIWVNRTYFGFGQYKKEDVTGGYRYAAVINPASLYDFVNDPLKLYPTPEQLEEADYSPYDEGAALTLYERRIKQRGFAGMASNDKGVGMLFYPMQVTELEPGETVATLRDKPKFSLANSDRLGTGYSTNVGVVNDENLNVTIENVSPENIKKQMDKINDFDIVKDSETGEYKRYQLPAYLRDSKISAEEKLERIMEFGVRNLVSLYKLYDKLPNGSALRERASRWYDGARLIAEDMAKIYGTTVEGAAAVLASMSPGQDWFQNVRLAKNVADIHQRYSDKPFAIADMTSDAAQRFLSGAKKPKDIRKQKDRLKLIENVVEGKTINELFEDAKKVLSGDPSRSERAAALEPLYLAVRIMSLNEHGENYDIIYPEGGVAGIATTKKNIPSKIKWQTGNAVYQSLAALRGDGSLQSISEIISKDHKVRSFFNNILVPNSEFGDVTSDTHHVGAVMGYPMAQSSLMVEQNFGKGAISDLGIKSPGVAGPGMSGTYWMYAEIARRAAAEVGVLPRQMQSITWEMIRQVYKPQDKTGKRGKALKEQVASIWEKYDGTNQQELFDEITKDSKIKFDWDDGQPSGWLVPGNGSRVQRLGPVLRETAGEKGDPIGRDGDTGRRIKLSISWDSKTPASAEFDRNREEVKEWKRGRAKSMLGKAAELWIDRQAEVKRQLEEEGFDEVIQQSVLRAGASAKAHSIFRGTKKKIATELRGLPSSWNDTFEKYLLMKRTVEATELQRARGVADFKSRVRYDDALSWLQEFEKQDEPSRMKVEKAADIYWQAMQDQLKDLYDNGLIGEEAYDSLIENHKYYSPRKFLDFMDPITGDAKGGGAHDSGIKALDRGSEGTMVTDPFYLLAHTVSRTQARVFRNRANESLAKAVEAGFNGGRILKGTQKARPQESIVTVFREGNPVRIAMPSQLAEEWNGSDPAISRGWAETLQWMSGTRPLKALATGANPEFFITNFPRDMAYAWFSSDEYSSFLPYGLMQLGSDYLRTAKDAITRSGTYNDYINEGGGMDFLTSQAFGQQSDVAGEGSLLKSVGALLGYLGETSEIATRLAVRSRAIRNGKNGTEATFVARNMLDFSQGGKYAKAADNVVPYLNAAIQGTRGGFRAFKTNPKVAAFKAAQVTAIGAAMAAFLKDAAEDLWDSLSEREKATKWIIPLPFKERDGNGDLRHAYLAIPKDQFQQFFAAIGQSAVDAVNGKPWSKQLIMSIQTNNPISTTSLPPAINAGLVYLGGYDTWTAEKVWRGSQFVSPSKEITARTPEIAKSITGSLSEIGIEVSPERASKAIGKVIPSSNPIGGMLDGAFKMATGGSDIGKTAVEKAWSTPVLRRVLRYSKPLEPTNYTTELAERYDVDIKGLTDMEARVVVEAAAREQDDYRVPMNEELRKFIRKSSPGPDGLYKWLNENVPEQEERQRMWQRAKRQMPEKYFGSYPTVAVDDFMKYRGRKIASRLATSGELDDEALQDLADEIESTGMTIEQLEKALLDTHMRDDEGNIRKNRSSSVYAKKLMRFRKAYEKLPK